MSSLYQNFDLTNGFNVLRIICGAFLLPHLYAKATAFNFMLGIYKEWRLEPPKAWLFGGPTPGEVCAPFVLFGLFTRSAPIPAPPFPFLASWAAWRYSKGKWLWNIGGCEYPFFWAICCIVVAMQAPA